jgi:large-conductance mechanosensitive channel
MRFALTSLFLGLSVQSIAEDVQRFVVQWLPLLAIIGLVIICLALISLASDLYEISKRTKEFHDSREKDASRMREVLTEIKQALEKKQG